MAIRIRNSAVVTIATTGAWSTIPTHGVLWANGIAVDSNSLAGMIRQPGPTDSISLPAGALQFDNTIASQNEPGIMEVFQAAVAAGTITWKISLHDGAPGPDYTANELTAGAAPGYVPGNGGRITISAQVITV